MTTTNPLTSRTYDDLYVECAVLHSQCAELLTERDLARDLAAALEERLTLAEAVCARTEELVSTVSQIAAGWNHLGWQVGHGTLDAAYDALAAWRRSREG